MLTSPPEPSELARAAARRDDVARRAHELRRRRTVVRSVVAVAAVVIAVTIPISLSRSSTSGRRVVTTAPTPTTCPPAGQNGCDSPSTSASPSPSVAPTPTTAPAAPALLERGKEGARSAIPWSQVGPGWTLALWSPAPGEGPGPQSPTGQPSPGPQAVTLYLVNPIGGRYSVTSFGSDQSLRLIDWSPTDHRALLLRDTDPQALVLTEVDLTSGQSRLLPLASGTSAEAIGLTRPSGRALLTDVYPVSPTGSSTPSLERLGLDGSHQLTYPTTFDHVGAFQGPWLSSADGTQLVLGATGGLALVGNDGRVIRELPVPRGQCVPTRWWTSQVVLVTCSNQLWLVPLSGSGPTALTAPLGGQGPDTGDLNAWSVGSTTFVQSAGACGIVYVAHLNPDGTTTPVTVPGVDSSLSVNILGAANGQLELFAGAGCGGGESVVWFDPATNTSSVVLGPPLNGGGVTSALPYPESES